MRVFWSSILLAAFAALAAPSTLAEDAEPARELGYRFEAGRALRYRFLVSRAKRWNEPVPISEISAEGDDVRIETLASGDPARIRITIERVRRSRRFGADAGALPPGMNSFEFDSAALDPDPSARDRELQAAMARHPELSDAIDTLGRSYELEVDRSGRVRSVHGTEDFLAGARRSLAEALELAPDAPLLSILGKRVEAELRNGFEAAFAILPDRPVRPGDSWAFESSRSLPPLGRLHERARAVLVSVSPEGRASLRSTSRVAFSMATPLGGDLGDSVAIEGAPGSGESRFVLDLATGTLREARAAVRIVLRTRLGGELEGFPLKSIREEVRETRAVLLLE